MARVRKFSGKTVDEATEIALDEMDVELEDVEIRVTRTGRSGILGFGGEPAEIDVALVADGGITDNEENSNRAIDVGTKTSTAPAHSSRRRGRGGNKGRSRHSGKGSGRSRATSSREIGSNTERISNSDSSNRSED